MTKTEQLDLFDENYRGEPDQTFTMHFAHGFDYRGCGTQTVGVQYTTSGQVVYWLTKDSREPTYEDPIIKTIPKDKEDGCLNCGFHRGNINSEFRETNEGLNCSALEMPRHPATVNLPTVDRKHLLDGCICPRHIEFGTSKWQKIALNTQAYSTTALYGGPGFTYGGKTYSHVNTFADYVILYGKGNDKVTIPIAEYKKVIAESPKAA